MKTSLTILSLALAAASVTACNKSPTSAPGAQGTTTQNAMPAPAPSGGSTQPGNQQPSGSTGN